MSIPAVRTLRALAILFFSSCIAAAAQADSQIITTNPASASQVAGSEDISLSIEYATDPANTQTTGIGIKIYFDSSKLEFVSLTESEAAGNPIGITRLPDDITEDTNNDDDDQATDSKANIAFAEFSGEFPDEDAWPADGAALGLSTIVFKSADQ